MRILPSFHTHLLESCHGIARIHKSSFSLLLLLLHLKSIKKTWWLFSMTFFFKKLLLQTVKTSRPDCSFHFSRTALSGCFYIFIGFTLNIYNIYIYRYRYFLSSKDALNGSNVTLIISKFLFYVNVANSSVYFMQEERKEGRREGKTTALQTDLESHRRAPEGCSIPNQSLSVLLKLVRVLAFLHIYSDIYFVQSIVMIIIMSLRFRENMWMFFRMFVASKPHWSIAAWKTKLLFKFWMENRLYTEKKACKVGFLKKLSLDSVYRDL